MAAFGCSQPDSGSSPTATVACSGIGAVNESMPIHIGRSEGIALSAGAIAHERQLEALRRAMGPELLLPLADFQVIEILLNPDGSLWIDRLSSGMERIGALDPVRSLTIITTVAALLDTVVTHDRPILECELPLDGSRFEALIPPLVERPTFSLRKKALLIFTLGDYVEGGIMAYRNARSGGVCL